MSSFEDGCAKTFLTCFTGFKLPFAAGFSLAGSCLIFFTIGSASAFPFSIVAKTLPLETLSPILTFRSFISPEEGEGISRLDLSLSIVTIGSFFFT